MNLNLNKSFTIPHYIFFLVIHAGISQGFVSVALPYLLTKHGFSVAAAAEIVAMGVFANVWRFFWGPIVDLSLSLKKWYWIGLSISLFSLLLICFIPLKIESALLFSVFVFISQVAGTFTLLPINGIMAKTVAEEHKGKSAGWYQAGSLAGVGIGGGVGLWLAEHYTIWVAWMAIGIISIVTSMFIIRIKDIHYLQEKTIRLELTGMGKDLLQMVKVPLTLFVMIMILLPISTGAIANVWASVAIDWKTSADTVALVTGILTGLFNAIGCIGGGYLADKKGVWYAYFATGLFCAFVNLLMVLFPYQPWVYVTGVLTYALATGLAYAAFTSLVLYAIGTKNVSTKFSLLSSLGNIPVAYMTVLVGWVHDKKNSFYMLIAEAALGIIFTILVMAFFKKFKEKFRLVRNRVIS